MMQDKKALQAGTSHFLGQNFAKASGIKYLSKEGREELAWTTSWGVSTRLIGALIMAHGDDDGLVLPPKLAPKHVVLLPIYRNDDDRKRVIEHCTALAKELKDQRFDGERVEVEIDDRDMTGGEKSWYHVKRGVPLRIEIGPRDIDAGVVSLTRRDRGPKERTAVPRAEMVARVGEILGEMQRGLLERATKFQQENTRTITDLEEFEAWFTPANADKPEIHGGFALSPFVDDKSIATKLAELKVTVRCEPLNQERGEATCMFTGQKTDRWAIYSKAY
jgi:prolyl-tRNA synthetase